MTPEEHGQAQALKLDNKLEELRDFLKSLCVKNKRDADAWRLLGDVSLRLNDMSDAEKCCRKLINIDGNTPNAQLNLGRILVRQGRKTEAIDCFSAAIAMKDNFQEAHYLRAVMLEETSQNREAVIAYQKSLELAPEHLETMNNLGVLLARQEMHQESINLLQKALTLDPHGFKTLTNLAAVLIKVSGFNQAIEFLERAILIKPDFPDAWSMLANALGNLGHFEKANDALDKVAELQPNNQLIAGYKAGNYQKLGEYQKAYEVLQPMLEKDGLGPGDIVAASAFFDFSHHLNKADEAAAKLQRILGEGEMVDGVRSHINFNLGKHYDRKKEYDRAFEYFHAGNLLSSHLFDVAVNNREIDAIIKQYSEDFVAKMPYGSNNTQGPIFILGMTRSGTSLTEQILASHPDVFGGGELPGIRDSIAILENQFGHGRRFPSFVEKLGERPLNGVARNYLDSFKGKLDGEQHTTDKMPQNFFSLGFIAQVFPEAPIIHCKRNALDNCLSCYTSNFGSVGHEYSNDLETMGHYYSAYDRLMNHWEKVLGKRIYTMCYEDLVQDKERVIRELLDFCGLDWDDRCLDFHKSGRAIYTLSYDQVRQPMYTSSINRWRNYERHLQPLRDVLDANNVECS